MPPNIVRRVMYIAPSCGHILLNLKLPFKLILRRSEVVFWCLEWECCTFWKIDGNHSNPPILCYGFNHVKDSTFEVWKRHSSCIGDATMPKIYSIWNYGVYSFVNLWVNWHLGCLWNCFQSPASSVLSAVWRLCSRFQCVLRVFGIVFRSVLRYLTILTPCRRQDLHWGQVWGNHHPSHHLLQSALEYLFWGKYAKFSTLDRKRTSCSNMASATNTKVLTFMLLL